MEEILEAYTSIRAACLRRPELAYLNPKELPLMKLAPYTGFCYIASHVFSYLTGAEIWCDEEKTHYWNKIDGEIWDLTEEQFDQGYHNYNLGRKVPRQKNLTKRAKELLDESRKS